MQNDSSLPQKPSIGHKIFLKNADFFLVHLPVTKLKNTQQPKKPLIGHKFFKNLRFFPGTS